MLYGALCSDFMDMLRRLISCRIIIIIIIIINDLADLDIIMKAILFVILNVSVCFPRGQLGLKS